MARTTESVIVNHAPWGTLVSAEERYVPSRQATVSHGRKTRYGLIRQTNIAARETIQVSKNVTNMTHTPYAFPKDVV